jgi:hypothetical protein
MRDIRNGAATQGSYMLYVAAFCDIDRQISQTVDGYMISLVWRSP